MSETVQGSDSETRCSELRHDGTKRRGPKPNPNALKFRTVGMQSGYWDFVALWADEDERAAGNLTPALQRMTEDARRMFPQGPEKGRERDTLGRWQGKAGAAPLRPSRTQLEAEIRRQAAQIAELQSAVDAAQPLTFVQRGNPALLRRLIGDKAE